MSLARIASIKNLCIMSKPCHEALLPVLYDKSLGKSKLEYFKDATLQNQFKRAIHTTEVRNDLGEGLKGLGAGVAALGTIGPGLGIGLIFQGYVTGVARNPSTAKDNLVNAFLGAALCEALGLMALMLGFLDLFG